MPDAKEEEELSAVNPGEITEYGSTLAGSSTSKVALDYLYDKIGRKG